MARYVTTTDNLDRAEQEWWHHHADLEERFCWVQPPDVQRRLRGHYLRRIAAQARPGDRVLEVGCGTGWLSLLLAEAGMASVTGIDFSPEQIRLAQAAAAKAQRGSTSVRFEVASMEQLVDEGRTYDVIVMHAFLHHLATAEILQVLAAARQLLAAGGRLVLLEPVLYGTTSGHRPIELRVLNKIERLPLGLSVRGLRPVSPNERQVRDRLEQRGAGVPPFGPSPKETAFDPGELAALLEGQLRVVERVAVASSCFLVAEQLLLAGLSQPRLWRVLRDPLLRLSSFLDQRLVAASPPPPGVWVFELFVCQV